VKKCKGSETRTS